MEDALRQNNSLRNISFIKCVLVILIVLYHSIIFMNGKWFSAFQIDSYVIPTYICKWLNSFTIYAFTFISGYIFCYQKLENGKYTKYLPFVLNKLKRLIIPYIFVSIIWVFPLNTIVDGFDSNRLIFGFLLGESPSQLWFLLMLFIVFLISWPLTNCFKKWYGLVIALGFYAIAFAGSHFLPDYFQIWTSLKFLFFFYLGFITRYKAENVFQKIPFWIWILLNVILFAALIISEKQDGTIFKLLSIGVGFLLNIAGTMMVWSTLNLLSTRFCLFEKSQLYFSQREA